MGERTYSLPEWNEHGTLRIDRQLSFVALFQEALTKRGVLEECTSIPVFAARSHYILHPRGTFLRVWWLVMIPVIAVTAIIVPYQVRSEPSREAQVVRERCLNVRRCGLNRWRLSPRSLMRCSWRREWSTSSSF